MTKAEAEAIFDEIHGSLIRIKKEIEYIKSKASDFDASRHNLDVASHALTTYLLELQEEIEALE